MSDRPLFPPGDRVTPTPHSDRCYRECTRDVIFVLRRKKLDCVSVNVDGLEVVDSEYLNVTDRDALPDWVKPLVEIETDEEGEEISATVGMSDFVQAAYTEGAEDDHGVQMVHSHWEVESVWLDRDEAEAYARRHAYRWPDGWQVYGVCAEGALAKLLRTQDGRTT